MDRGIDTQRNMLFPTSPLEAHPQEMLASTLRTGYKEKKKSYQQNICDLVIAASYLLQYSQPKTSLAITISVVEHVPLARVIEYERVFDHF